MTETNFRALCEELMNEAIYLGSIPYDQAPNPELIAQARAALAQPEPVALSPKEVDAREAFTQLRDEILHLSGPLEVNEVLGSIDYYTPEWV
jgi:hypothetical protein